MAMIKCKNCGKEITDIYDNCPYCKTPVHSQNSVSDVNSVTNDDLTENLILTGYGSFLALIGLYLFNSLSSIYCGRALGDYALAASGSAWSAFFLVNLIFLFLGAVLFTFVPLIIKRFAEIPDFISVIITTVLLTVCSFIVINVFKMSILSIYNTSPIVIEMASQLAIYYSVAMPLLQGSMVLAGKNHTPLFGVIFELLPLIVFIVVGIVLLLIFVFTFSLGIMGISIAGVIALIVAFAAAAVKSLFIKGF